MAGVYGGDAHFQKARPGIKYDKERVIKGHIPRDTSVPVPREFDIAHGAPVGNPNLVPLANTVSGFHQPKGSVHDSGLDNLS